MYRLSSAFYFQVVRMTEAMTQDFNVTLDVDSVRMFQDQAFSNIAWLKLNKQSFLDLDFRLTEAAGKWA